MLTGKRAAKYKETVTAAPWPTFVRMKKMPVSGAFWPHGGPLHTDTERQVTRPQQHDPDQLAFQQYRTVLFSVAYRLLGTAADAEDVVQDAWLKWSAAERSQVADPKPI